MPSLAVIVFYLEVAGLSNVINVAKIIVSTVVSVLTVVLESTFYEIISLPNIRSREGT